MYVIITPKKKEKKKKNLAFKNDDECIQSKIF